MTIRLRAAEPRDALDVAGVNVRSWQVAYRGLIADAYLDGLRAEERAARYTFGAMGTDQPSTIVAVDGDAIIGFATTAAARDEDAGGQGELCALYVDPAWWDRGVGRTLVAAARERLVADGFGSAVLWALAGNRRAARFYEIDGWTADGTERAAEVWGITVDEVRYRRSLP